jgi:sorting nexin-4
MLGSFLNRVCDHPILSVDHLFHQFLDPDTDWVSELNPFYLLGLFNNHQILKNYVGAAKAVELKNSSGRKISLSISSVKNPDPKFLESDSFTKRFGAHMKNSIYKPHKGATGDLAGEFTIIISRRITLKRFLSVDIAIHHTELGNAFNGLSLSDIDVSASLAHAEEEVGMACESTHQHIQELVGVKTLFRRDFT